MTTRLSRLISMAILAGTFIVSALTLPAGASSWPTYAAQCSKWIADIPKLDSYIIEDNTDGNKTALTASIVAMYQDGKYIAACDTSPDAQLNGIARQWGIAIQHAAAYGYLWVTHNSPTTESNFVSAEYDAKRYENEFANRLAALGR